MSKRYGRQLFVQHPKPADNPPAGFSQLFFDSENNGAATVLLPSGAVTALAPLPFFIGGATTVAAANAITIPNNYSIVTITPSAGTTANVVTLPPATETRFLFIYNSDNNGTSGAVAIPAGKLVQLLSLGGSWHVVGVATTL